MRYLLILLPFLLFANTCLECHSSKIQECKGNVHFTLKNAINITRKAFGIKDSNVTLLTLPKASKTIKEPKDLVDDLLRRKCLHCHLSSKQLNPSGNLCLSCHAPHTNKSDSFKAKPTQQKCLKCHNGEFIGSDYLGKFPHDFDKSYRAPLTKDGFYPDAKDGIDYHHLNKDIHAKAGLTCISCHNKTISKDWLKPKCISCHKSISPQNHQNYHKNLSCTSCHANWMVNSYNLNLLRDDTANYKQWRRLTIQFDPYLQKFLNKALTLPTPPAPQMPDYLTNNLEKGIWYSGWKFRRWENFILAQSSNGKIELAKPMFQYKISYKDSNGTMVLDNVTTIDNKKIEAFLVKHPHTITKEGKSCEMCHNNPILFNPDYINKNLFQGQLINAKPLSKTLLQKMQSHKYKTIRAKILFEK